MIKIAFIKFGGMANGGTEKYLQTIAAHLPKDEFDVDFFYCDAAPYICLLYTSPSPRDVNRSRMPSSA